VKLGRWNAVHVTPTMFVNGVRYEGAKDITQLRTILDAAEREEVRPNADSVQTRPGSSY
jgi:hypothetical protein